MDANSNQAGSNQPSGSKICDNFSISNDTWNALNMPLDDTPQISYTQLIPCTDFNASSDVPSTVLHISISSPTYQLPPQLLGLEFENIMIN